MQLEIQYEARHQYWKTSFGQGSWQDTTTFLRYLPWDGERDFRELLEEVHPGFFKKGRNLRQGERNYHFVISGLRVGGPGSSVIIPIEKVIITVLEEEPVPT